MITLRPYQEELVQQTAAMLASGKRKVLVQLPTGGGKTIAFSSITNRWLAKQSSSVLILVHRKELLTQTRRTLFDIFKISAQPIVAGMRHIPKAKVYIGMIESAHRRISMIKDIGLVIIDEAHLANFFKVHELFTTQFVLGFTATPYSANKKKPLKDYYEEVITTIQVQELIKCKSLSQNITYAPRDVVERAALTMKGGDFDESKMAIQFSAPRYVDNTVKAYQKYAPGTRALIFNVNIDHSKQVDAAFRMAGFLSKHLDGTMGSQERAYLLNWFKSTPGAILNNVGIATTGTDIPNIETAIMNRATKSPILWLQCTGRAARTTQFKNAFTIIDLGGNALEIGDWSDDRDWYDIFHNPKKPRKTEQVAPCKNCPQCDAIIAASARTCNFCGYEYPPREQALENELSDFVIITRGIDVSAVIESNRDKKKYYAFFNIGRKLADEATQTIPKMTDEIADFILKKYEILVDEWCEKVGKAGSIKWHHDRAKEHLFTLLAERYKKWNNPIGLVDLTKDTVIHVKQPPVAPSHFNNLTKLQAIQMIGR